MISSAAHPRWPLRLPSWVWFPSIRGQMPGSSDRFFFSMISSAAHSRWPLRPPSWIWFPSIRGQTLGSIDPIFSGLLGWLEEGSFQWSAPLLIKDGHYGHYGHHLGFHFCQLSQQRLVRFVCGLLGVTGGRFPSMISTAAHSRWPLAGHGIICNHNLAAGFSWAPS
jgi:hypothetical protein